MKIDPYNNEKLYNNWKESIENKDLLGISKANSNLTKHFLRDMETGMNVALGSKKGSRSYGRLRALKAKIIFFSKQFKEHFNLNLITNVEEEQLHILFTDMRNGKLRKKNNEVFKAPHHYVKVFKAFWHWHMKVQKKKGKLIQDITVDLDTTGEKPKWVYLSEEDVRKLWDNAQYEYKILLMFLFDSGIRAPTELSNVRISDFYEDFKKLAIREETSKTFGRKINLMICSEVIKEYVKSKKLKDSDFLFNIIPYSFNKYLKRLAIKVLGEGKTLAGEPYSDISMYDLRHSSACYWLPRYKSESAMKYRFGWKKSDMIHYYTELLGMKDTIGEEDMLIDVTKTEIEQKLIKSEKDKVLMQEKITSLENQMQNIYTLTNELARKLKHQELLH